MATQVAQGQVVRVRRETPERWAKALSRALTLGLEVFVVADTGERMVTSASKLDTLHRTDGRRCTCEAALAGDPVCQHRAVVRFVMGWLPEAPAELGVAVSAETLAPATRECMWCHGTGWVPNDYHQRYDECDVCGGTGCRPDNRPSGAPAFLPVAAA